MKKQEAVLISAYTGFLLTKDFFDVHKFCEELLGRPIWTHEFANEAVQKEIQEKCKPLILEMIEGETDDAHPTEKVCTGKRCPMQVGYDVKNCKDKDCIYRTETEKGGVVDD